MHTNESDLNGYRMSMVAAGLATHTIRLRCWQLRRLGAAIPGSLRGLTATDLVSYLASMTWSPATRYGHRQTLIGFYRWMEAEGRVRRSPAAALPPIRVPRREPIPAPEAVVAMARGDERALLMVDLAARQGLRRAEIAAVHSRDIVPDLDGWSLVVHGKGSVDRTIPLHTDIADRLRARGSGWIFPSQRTSSHLCPNRVGDIIAGALPPGWTAHSLRRRFATRAYDGQRDLRSVQVLLGHESIATTQRYIGIRAQSLREALRAAA